MSKKVQVLKNGKSIALDYKKDWNMIGYYTIMQNYGRHLKWHQKLRLYTACKIQDLIHGIKKG